MHGAGLHQIAEILGHTSYHVTKRYIFAVMQSLGLEDDDYLALNRTLIKNYDLYNDIRMAQVEAIQLIFTRTFEGMTGSGRTYQELCQEYAHLTGKGTLIIKNGIDAYLLDEKNHQHHRLVKLADYIPDLSDKDKVILELISSFTEWAGRYPAPKPKREDQREDIFKKSNSHQISARDLFDLSARVMRHTSIILSSK